MVDKNYLATKENAKGVKSERQSLLYRSFDKLQG